jgi:hypothetical protein
MTNTKRLNPLNDYIFLKIMGEKGDEEQLLAFLNAVLGRHGKVPAAWRKEHTE